MFIAPLCACVFGFRGIKPVAGTTRRFMLAFIAATAAVETVIQNTVSVTADLTNGETKTYKLVLDVDVRSRVGLGQPFTDSSRVVRAGTPRG